MPRYSSVAEQLEEQSIPEPNSGCQLWLGTVSVSGYGTVTANKRTGQKVHRLAYEVANGAIPAGMHVLHKCDVRCCINPAHLFLGSNADNVIDKVAKGRQSYGLRTGRAKLTEAEVLQIREFKGTNRQAAELFDIGKSQAHLIMSGNAWRSLV